jgi:hypothetical protein
MIAPAKCNVLTEKLDNTAGSFGYFHHHQLLTHF